MRGLPQSLMAAGFAAALIGGLALALATVPAHAQATDTDMIPPEEIEDTYRARKQGRQLYRAEKFKEAEPYLLFAAERGFKDAQTQLGQIYVRGLGGVEADLVQGIGWLGVAASGKSDPRTRKLYKQVRGNIPEEHDATVEKIVNQFIENYDGRRTRVTCKLESSAGRYTKESRCRFIDESNYPSLNVRG